MKNNKLYAAATALAVVSATISLTAAPPEAEAATQLVVEAEPQEAAILPAIGLVAVGGLVGAFALGVAQGYMEEVNSQGGTQEPTTNETLSEARPQEFDYVLN
ncbi:hypothetical protein G6O69_14830 [Pseudenhygromyxa sp. WMMC2535]|uniref:hypothetical protein n=1 Tax=Pseudenhygromyxa sp. WMMC2535 TaxID=2712867 RepID=UPI001557C6CC|nr:hypothetical protein [Pseudenhygromyxa sp. WMMC2535]NVB39116.1 hypothetical protein [Pseudenhygromyxa sp. WMMC2535]